MDCRTPSVHHRTDMPATPGRGPCPHLWARNEPRVHCNSPRVASGRDIPSPGPADMYPAVETAASELRVHSIALRVCTSAVTIDTVSSADPSTRALGGPTPLRPWHHDVGAVLHRHVLSSRRVGDGSSSNRPGSRPQLCARNEHRVRVDSHRVASGRDVPNPAQPDAYPAAETAASELSTRSRMCSDSHRVTLGRDRAPTAQPEAYSTSPRLTVLNPAGSLAERATSGPNERPVTLRERCNTLTPGRVSYADLLISSRGDQLSPLLQRPDTGAAHKLGTPGCHRRSDGGSCSNSEHPSSALGRTVTTSEAAPARLDSPEVETQAGTPTPPSHSEGPAAPAPLSTPPQRTVLSVPNPGNAALTQSLSDCAPGPHCVP
jgi:hypothetical protein